MSEQKEQSKVERLKLKKLAKVEYCPDCATKLMSDEHGVALVCPNPHCNYIVCSG